jgi:SAM-dependent methyltransferase
MQHVFLWEKNNLLLKKMKNDNLLENYLEKHLDFGGAMMPIEKKIEWIKYNFLQHYNNENKNLNYLDIGPGLGETLVVWNKIGIKNIHSIDLSPEVVAYIKNLGFNCDLIEATEYLKCHKGEFDFINMNDVLEHIPKDELVELGRAVKSALKQGGKFLVKVPNAQSPFFSTGRYADLTHVQSFTEQSLFQFFGIIGFNRFSFFHARYRADSFLGLISKYIVMPSVFGLTRLLRAGTFHMNPKILTEAIIVVAEKE